jgi:predicted HTH domain antitoxin
MSGEHPKVVVVPVELPADAAELSGLTVEEIAAEMRLLWILDLVRRHHISQGRGAELAAMPRADFMDLMGEHGIPVIDLSPDELDAEVEMLEHLLASK